MKVLLMNPPMTQEELYSENAKEFASKIPPLGLGYLGSYLKLNGIEVEIWDGFVEKDSWEDIRKKAEGFDLLGIHALTSFVLRSYEFAKFLKDDLPGKPIVFGGCHVTALPLEAMSHDFIDYAVVGEAEQTLLELCRAIDTKSRNLRDIEGLYFRDRAGKVFFSGPRKAPQDLDALPMPARELFNWPLYKTSMARKKSVKQDMGILTSRGCPYQCSFCSKDVTGHKVRYFSLERVMDEIKHIVNTYNVDEISFWDETFTMDRERVIELCNRIKKEGLGISWTCSTRADRVDESLLRNMKDSGCNFIAYGIESGNEDILKLTKKNITKEKIRNAVKLTKQAGIYTRGYFVIGLIGDTAKTIQETISFAKELDLDLATFSLMIPLPNTLDYERASRQKGFQKEYWKQRMFPEFHFMDDPIYVPENMSKKEFMELHKKAYESFYLRPRFMLRQLRSITSFQDINRLVKGFKTVVCA